MAKRIQRKRTKGWRLPENTVCVSRPSKWGNPYLVQRRDDYEGMWIVVDVRDGTVMDHAGEKTDALSVASDCFREELERECGIIKSCGGVAFDLANIRCELRGRHLACWCPLPEPGGSDHCHAAVLLKIANEQGDSANG